MADDITTTSLEVRIMTIDEVKENPPKIDRKFVLIDSSLYTDEAYEYILELINETDSIAFIRDLKKIYTHGEFFGGDLWEDSLFYFGNFQILTEDDELKVTLEAEEQKEALRLKGINNLEITAEENYVNGEKLKTIIFNYDISNVVNTSKFTIDDSTAEYNLEIENNQIVVNKYIPIRIEKLYDLPTLEYDSSLSQLSFPVTVYGTDTNKNIYVSSSTGDEVSFDSTTGILTATIENNNRDINYLFVYSDTNTQDSYTITQKYNYAVVYGDTIPADSDTFFSMNRYIIDDSIDGEISIEIKDDGYGWFACPSIYNPIFIDKESNIGGGWKLFTSKQFYSLGIMYNIYRTEQEGLGLTRWIIKNFE